MSLPDKLSEGIVLALRDLRKAEASPDYEVNMNMWHTYYENEAGNNICEVCLAGAVMAFSLDSNTGKTLEPGDFPQEDKLIALNMVRRGVVRWALLDWGENIDDDIEDFNVPHYDADPDGFYVAMRKIVSYLRKRGL